MSHAERVASSYPPDTLEHVVALYHDHLEDGFGEAIPKPVRKHVVVLTRRDDEMYFRYIDRIRDSGDPVAVAVKISDLKDNLARCYGCFGGRVDPKLAQRYLLALERLGVPCT